MRSALICVLLLLQAASRQEAGGYYRKWLEEDVCWIIAEEERAVFLKLGTDEERDYFIEQFWARRDPDPSTAENEAKIEHYRRIVYANEHFSAGISGWKSDRGMIYIKFGPPDRFESFPGGGPYARERKEGGGMTTVFPFERWEYRRIEGVGEDVELEFVDDKGGGLYELTWDKRRKDALLYSGRMGLTQDEIDQLALTGTVDKRDRITGRREAGELKGIYAGTGGFETAKDKPFAQLAASAGLNRPPAIRFKDLEAVVTARVTYDGFLFEAREDFIRITDQQILVPVTVRVANNRLSFRREGETYRAVIRLYGRVLSLANRVEAVFEDEVAREFAAADFERAQERHSVYQKRLILKPGLYRLEMAAMDVDGKRIGTLERRLEVRKCGEEELCLSSLILAEQIESGTQDRSSSSFILGDLKVVPKTDDAFRRSGSLGLYVQVYNFSLDAQSRRPSLRVEYGISSGGAEPAIWRDATAAVQFAGSYCRLARMVSLGPLAPGEHVLQVRVRDTLSGRSATARSSFRVIE